VASDAMQRRASLGKIVPPWSHGVLYAGRAPCMTRSCATLHLAGEPVFLRAGMGFPVKQPGTQARRRRSGSASTVATHGVRCERAW